ncbi:hypothetical protein SapgrDRAFT_3194 [Saprospira grandis DSM 2844]|uniref:Uncharacterized protein n=1 Tax=Saprospira grandis DSM 2844 TaxID=694433 RepID=J0P4Q6_9BACT|nr:hypothetical protein SapgrDRAFT_3194 [Saprospira grandis DSM 2844]
MNRMALGPPQQSCGGYSLWSSNCGLKSLLSFQGSQVCSAHRFFALLKSSVWPAATPSHRLLPLVVELRPKGLVVAK